MRAAEPVFASWRAELALEFERRAGRTVLAARRHDGPLVVQKPLYPEGGELCHAIVVHPPAGIAGGDDLELAASVRDGARALLTTPGATKWYRTAGPWARQRLAFGVAGALEWLPQETIVFDGALAEISCEIELARAGRYLGWEILCLGRIGSGERFVSGECRLRTEVRRDGRLVWFERGGIPGGGAMRDSAVGLQGRTVYATLLAAAPEVDKAVVDRCRQVLAPGRSAVTALPGLLIARHLGDSSEAAKRELGRLWAILRPALLGRDAVEPRIWRT